MSRCLRCDQYRATYGGVCDDCRDASATTAFQALASRPQADPKEALERLSSISAREAQAQPERPHPETPSSSEREAVARIISEEILREVEWDDPKATCRFFQESDPYGSRGRASQNAADRILALLSQRPAPDEEAPRCFACLKSFKVGDRYYLDASGGEIHASCCGPEREGYTGPDGEPLKDGEPIPEPAIWTADDSAPALTDPETKEDAR